MRDFLAPFATKQALLRSANPLLKSLASRQRLTNKLRRVLLQNDINYLDLGGAIPIEEYLVIHLSPVEPYGRPSLAHQSYSYLIDSHKGTCSLVPRTLTSPSVVLTFDALQGLPLVDSSLRGINTSHFLEHFTIDQGRFLVHECYRVLAPGGTLRISCPDLRRYAAAYFTRDTAFFESPPIRAVCNYEGLESLGDRFICKAYDNDNGHKWFYDAESAISLALGAGFTTAQERDLHVSALPHIASVEPAYRAAETFYVEATK